MILSILLAVHRIIRFSLSYKEIESVKKQLLRGLGIAAFLMILSCGDSSISKAGADDFSSSLTVSSSSSSVTIPASSSEVVPSSSSSVLLLSSSSEFSSSSSSLSLSSSSSSAALSSSAIASSSLSAYCNTAGNCGAFIDDRDGQAYNWTKIGTQIWMAENLAYLPSVNSASESYSFTVAKYYVYNNFNTSVSDAKTSSYYATYGVLYNWSAAMAGAGSSFSIPSGVQGVCPNGWHLPSYYEWTELVDYAGGEPTAGAKLKAQNGWSTYNAITNEDSYGFSAMPGGRYDVWAFDGALQFGIFWSTTESNSQEAWYRSMGYENTSMYKHTDNKYVGYSVRCVKD